MVLELPVTKLIDKLGHDGSEKYWPNLPEPLCRRAFHIEEMIWVALEFGYLLIAFNPGFNYNPTNLSSTVIYDFTGKMNKLLDKNNGIMLGRYRGSGNRHAVAWSASEKVIYDPSGYFTTFNDFKLSDFYAAYRL